MRLQFITHLDETGTITEDLKLSYEGRDAEQIEAVLSGLEGSLVKHVADTEGMEMDPNVDPPRREVPMEGSERLQEVRRKLPRQAHIIKSIKLVRGAEKAAERGEPAHGPTLVAKREVREGARESLRKGMDSNSMSMDEFDDLLFRAHKRTVWETTDDLAKSPDMWRGDERVPQFVQDWLAFVVKNTDVGWDGPLKGLPADAHRTVKDVIADDLTQPQGWSIRSISEGLLDLFESEGMQKGQAVNIARTEVGAYLNTAREEAFKAQEASTDADRGLMDERKYDWVGPRDHRETDICEEIRSRVRKAKGMTISELKETLHDVALEYVTDGGTPERARDWLPHYQCRKTFVPVTPGSRRW